MILVDVFFQYYQQVLIFSFSKEQITKSYCFKTYLSDPEKPLKLIPNICH